jgi:hypothetical protein
LHCYACHILLLQNCSVRGFNIVSDLPNEVEDALGDKMRLATKDPKIDSEKLRCLLPLAHFRGNVPEGGETDLTCRWSGRRIR